MEVYPLDPTFRLADSLILASLSREPKYGYQLEAHVVNMAQGRIRPGYSTVYKSLKRLQREGLVAAIRRDPGERRQYYDITRQGRAQLGRDLGLMRNIIHAFDTRTI